MAFFPPRWSSKYAIYRPMLLFSLLTLISGLITFFRYSNFFPFTTDSIYELVTNAFGVSAGGAIMSIVFNVLSYITGLGFFFFLSQEIQSKEFVRKISVVLCLSTLFSLGFGLFQHFKDLRIGNNPLSISGFLINATFKDALSFGAYLSLVTPLLLGISLAYKGIVRIFSFLLIVFSVYLMFSTGSKSGLLGLLISLSLFFILFLFVAFQRLRSKTFSFKKVHYSTYIVIVLTLSLIFSFFVSNISFIRKLKNSTTYLRLNNMIQLKKFDNIFAGRANTLWKMAFSMIKDYPLTGVGVGGYIIEASNYSAITKTPIGTPESAENYFLQVTSELGLLGLFFSLWIFWEILKRIFVNYGKFPNTDQSKFLLIGAISGFAAFLFNVQVHSYIGSYEITYAFWLLIGLIFSLSQGTKIAQNYTEKVDLATTKVSAQKPFFNKRLKILAAVLVVLYSVIHLWNSTHSLSLKNRTEQLGIKQDFGLDKLEKTNKGREFRWTRSYGGLTIKIEKPVIVIPLLASHPDIQKKPLKVKLYLVKDFFKSKRLLKEITLTRTEWQDVALSVPEDVGREAILLIKVSRTWNPLKTTGAPDARDLGVAVGKISFRDY
jgi:hypothetical protein